jgi:[ribosomal protein S18]-alanine N-acetyltransferase
MSNTSVKTSKALKGLRFEALGEHHVSSILEIEKRTNTAPWSDRSFRHEVTNPHAIFLIAILDGRVVGYGGVWLVVDEAHVTTVAVDEDLRRMGIGRRLMIELLKQAKERGMACSTLEVRASNVAAITLYEQLGYATISRRKSYYPDNREDAVVMWLNDLRAWKAPIT